MRISNIFIIGTSKLGMKSIVAPCYGVMTPFLIGLPEDQTMRFLLGLPENQRGGSNTWVLKGGYALEMRFAHARATKDIDLNLPIQLMEIVDHFYRKAVNSHQ